MLVFFSEVSKESKSDVECASQNQILLKSAEDVKEKFMFSSQMKEVEPSLSSLDIVHNVSLGLLIAPLM